MKRLLLLGLLAAVVNSTGCAGVKHKEVEYAAEGTTMEGYLAMPAGQDKRPAVLVVHEWWGHNEYARKRADMLAELGYVALAVDMYGEGKQADHPKTAGQFAGEVRNNMDMAEKRFEAAMDVLKANPRVQSDHIAAIGYCFGGGIVLEMARRGVDLDGVVSFHGSLGTGEPAEAGQVKAKVLVYNGADDPFTKPEQVEAFIKEMDAAGVDYEFVNLPGAKHSFTNPGADKFGKQFNLPLEYNAEADAKSWAGMQDFLKEAFKD